jgi:hypothetical protein
MKKERRKLKNKKSDNKQQTYRIDKVYNESTRVTSPFVKEDSGSLWKPLLTN